MNMGSAAAMLQRKGTIAEQSLNEPRHRPEGREFPPAAFVREEEAGGAVRGIDGAQQDRYQGQRNPAAVETKNKCDTAEKFGCYHRVGEEAGKTQALEEARGAGRGEDHDLEPGVRKKQHAHGDPKDGCSEIAIGHTLQKRVAGGSRHSHVGHLVSPPKERWFVVCWRKDGLNPAG